MRNRTAIRLLYLLAVVAAILPPVILLGYSYKLSVSATGHDLQNLSDRVVHQTEWITDEAISTLQRVADQAANPGYTAENLRYELHRNPFLQAINLRSGDEIILSSDSSFSQVASTSSFDHSTSTPIGSVTFNGPVADAFPVPALVVTYRAGPDLFIDGFLSSKLIDEFSGKRHLPMAIRVLTFFNSSTPVERLENPGTAFNDRAPIQLGVQTLKAQLLAKSESDRFPIQATASSDLTTVVDHIAHSGPRFVAAGLLISGILCWLIIRTARRLNTIESDLREAIKFEEISVYYQPVIELETNRCVGAEALMRWEHPVRGLTRAGDFVDIAEKTQLIIPMTDRVISIVAEDFKTLLAESPELHVAINLAACHFTNTRILDTIRERLHGVIPLRNVVFEITERSLVTGSDSVGRTVMNGLIEYGAKLAIDDFGTGYSNLNYLQRFPVSYLKIDKIFVDQIKSDTTEAPLVNQIIRIGKMLKMDIIAEGIEHASQAGYLRSEGVQLAQGWFFGEPMPFEEFRHFVLLHNTDDIDVPSPELPD